MLVDAYEFLAMCLFLIPAALFLFIILTSIVLRVANVNLQEQATTFCLKAYGWLGKDEICYASKYVRWGSGIVFTLSYGSVLAPQLAIVLRTPNIGNLSIFVLSCTISYCSFLTFVGSYYSGAVHDKEGMVISPLRLTGGIRLNDTDKEQFRVKSLGKISLVYCPQWKQGRIVLLSKKQLFSIANITNENEAPH